VPKVVSRLPSVLYLTRVKSSLLLLLELPTTTILLSKDWMPRAWATALTLPIGVVTMPLVPKVVSREPEM
jgi:ABC-type cobalamin transport system permease subunit